MIDFRRDDLNYGPSAECAPAGKGRPFNTARAGHTCTCGSRYLCEVCNPRRTYLRAALETSLRRTERRAEVVVLSGRRRGK